MLSLVCLPLPRDCCVALLGVPWVCLQFVIVVLHDHTRILFSVSFPLGAIGWSVSVIIGFPGHVYLFGINVTKPVFGVSDKVRSNQSPRLQRLARKLKFRSWRVWI